MIMLSFVFSIDENSNNVKNKKIRQLEEDIGKLKNTLNLLVRNVNILNGSQLKKYDDELRILSEIDEYRDKKHNVEEDEDKNEALDLM